MWFSAVNKETLSGLRWLSCQRVRFLYCSFITGSYDRTCKLWNTSSGEEMQTFEGHRNVVYAIAFNNPYGLVYSLVTWFDEGRICDLKLGIWLDCKWSRRAKIMKNVNKTTWQLDVFAPCLHSLRAFTLSSKGIWHLLQQSHTNFRRF